MHLLEFTKKNIAAIFESNMYLLLKINSSYASLIKNA